MPKVAQNAALVFPAPKTQTRRENAMEKRVTFEELKAGMKVRFEQARNASKSDDEVIEGKGAGTVHQVTKHLVVFMTMVEGGPLRVSGTRVEMMQGRMRVWALHD
jgi:hypothetical protein